MATWLMQKTTMKKLKRKKKVKGLEQKIKVCLTKGMPGKMT